MAGGSEVAQSRAASRRKSRSDPEPDQGDTGIRQTGLGPRQAVQVGPALGVLATDHRRIHRVPALLQRLAGIQQCCAHVIRRCRAVTKPGPGGLQSWAGDIIAILREAHAAVEAARARGDTALDQQVLDDLLERYDQAVKSGMTRNRLRDWHDGNHPGYALGAWLRDYREQVFLFTRNFNVAWTNNVSEVRHEVARVEWVTRKEGCLMMAAG
jgi:hypothetical protein